MSHVSLCFARSLIQQSLWSVTLLCAEKRAQLVLIPWDGSTPEKRAHADQKRRNETVLAVLLGGV